MQSVGISVSLHLALVASPLPDADAYTESAAGIHCSTRARQRPCLHVELSAVGYVLRPVGAGNFVTSRHLQILMDETAEAVSSQWSDGRAGGRGSAACGRVLIE